MLVAGCHGEPVIIPTVGHYLSETCLTTTRTSNHKETNVANLRVR